jgi:hypothetical protein
LIVSSTRLGSSTAAREPDRAAPRVHRSGDGLDQVLDRRRRRRLVGDHQVQGVTVEHAALGQRALGRQLLAGHEGAEHDRPAQVIDHDGVRGRHVQSVTGHRPQCMG